MAADIPKAFMATLIPSIGSCTFATGGERRFAERLESKLEGDYHCWYDVAVGANAEHPDFVILHPRRGLLILEVKDWRRDTIVSIDRLNAVIHTSSGVKTVANPLEQARRCAHGLTAVLERDPQLVAATGSHQGCLCFPWGHGVVLPNITRKMFEETDLAEVLPPHRVICQDEMFEDVDPEVFQSRLWAMMSVRFDAHLSLPQIDRVRWHVFPDVRIAPRQETLFADEAPPDLMQVMDMQQEQLARSLGEGHRLIHGPAGSGKTLILGYRAERLAKLVAKPILILCYNESLARRLAQTMRAKGLDQKVHTHHFHQWCRAQLVAYQAGLPPGNEDKDAFFADMVARLIRAVDRKLVPAAQYDAVLIDEGHDFRPEWLKLVVQMVDPRTNSLLVLYDDAQSIYGGETRKKFSFKSVGIQAAGRTTILRVNYRNTDEIQRFARDVAQSILNPTEADDDGVPLVPPRPAGRHGPPPQVVKLPSLRDEAEFIARRLQDAHRRGMAWRDMAVIYRSYHRDARLIRKILPAFGIPTVYFDDATYAANEDKVLLITMHSCKGLEFPLVVIPGTDRIRGMEDLPPQEAKLLYVAMTRATQELVLSGAG